MEIKGLKLKRQPGYIFEDGSILDELSLVEALQKYIKRANGGKNFLFIVDKAFILSEATISEFVCGRCDLIIGTIDNINIDLSIDVTINDDTSFIKIITNNKDNLYIGICGLSKSVIKDGNKRSITDVVIRLELFIEGE